MSAPGGDAAWRRSNLGHLLFVATGACVAEALAVVRAGGFPGVTEAQLALFGHLDPDGTRLTTLAARADVMKQSSIEIVDRAVRAGLVVRLPDPRDARAKIVLPTAAGDRLLRLARRGSAAAGRLVTVHIGPARSEALRRGLAAYTGRLAPLDQMLAAAARLFVRDVLAAVHLHGYDDVTEASLSPLRHLELAGSRLTELAARARITKQSMRCLVERASTMGLVTSEPDGVDRRARLIRFTPAGLAMLEFFRAGVERAERRFVERTGADLDALKEALGGLAAVDYSTASPLPTNVGGAAANSPGRALPKRR